MITQSIVIVGAGAAGLIAANKLSATFNITVLEARDRIGGRINTLTIQDQIIEGGAEFIHGNLPVTLQLLKDAQINYVAGYVITQPLRVLLSSNIDEHNGFSTVIPFPL